MDQELTVTSTSDDTPPLTQIEIDQRVFDLYDEYCHGRLDRRVFLAKSAAATAGGLAMAQALLPRYAWAQTISFTDPRIKARYVSYPSPGGTSGTMRGYLVQPAGNGPFPTVLVIHENRGLNPYIEDVARRAATEGFLALAPHQRHVARLRDGAECSGSTARDAQVPRHAARLPQQLNAAFRRARRQARLGPHHCALQEVPGVKRGSLVVP